MLWILLFHFPVFIDGKDGGRVKFHAVNIQITGGLSRVVADNDNRINEWRYVWAFPAKRGSRFSFQQPTAQKPFRFPLQSLTHGVGR